MSAPALESLASAHQKSSRQRRLVSVLLLLPLLIYTAVFFVLPIGMMLYRAISNPELVQAFPRAVQALEQQTRSDSSNLPGDAVFEAVEQDFMHVENLGVIGEAARRMNYENSGYRFLITATARRYQWPANQPPVSGESPHARLTAIDPRWSTPELWEAFERASPAYTSYYLLTALDLERTTQGIQRVAPDKRVYLDLTFKTLKIAFVVSVLCLLLGFPFAVLLVKASRPFQMLLILAVMLPFWTSLLARTTAWIVVLQEKGIVNTLLLKLGLIDQPLPMIFDALGVYIVMVHILLPFTVLPLYSVMKGIPAHYMRASGSLGAHPVRGFLHVYLPLTLTGVGSGTLLTFIVAAGYYVTPTLVGSAREQMLGYFIAFYTNTTVNWGMASALGLVLILCVMAIYLVAARLVGIRQIAGLK
ncbi:spermidine/putrescine ABC transporter permease [Pseudomonas sp. Bc-h]|uniref:ABC transporter permease n=1 Tax=Pseudomonas sp. Bc-h TaxID=1943632 RepID=UPI0009DAE61C|nr:ABC transporter permease [Pseudomonas sp. Bc-h]OQR36714.1 spermidine/putrescine ABC transporter permease [Pseudomonas sp. Bc-h]